MADIIIVGLGPGSPTQISLGALQALKSADHIYLRTAVHPVVPWLVKELNLSPTQYTAFDSYYETADSFDEVYQRILTTLTAKVYAGEKLTYCVPGHPGVAETTAAQLVDWAEREAKAVEIMPSMSCLDAVYAVLGIDPTMGVTIGDALDMPDLIPRNPMLLTQVYNRLIASDVKLRLMNQLHDEHPITVVRAAGIPGEERVATIPLYQLDTVPWLDHLTSVYVDPPDLPVSETDLQQTDHFYPLDPLVNVMQRLRAPDGCPWDQVQTHESLRRYLVEETYEVLEAIDQGRWDNVEEELGDVLLQVVFHAEIAAENGRFDINDVISTVTEKLIRRHPHVFGSIEVEDAEEVSRNWEKIKKRERERTGNEYTSLLDGVPLGLPALTQAEKTQAKAARIGFEWEDISGAIAKVKEEMKELKDAWKDNDQNAVDAELGDVLFALVNVARYLDVDPEMALREATRKFTTRFRYIEDTAAKQGRNLAEMSLQEMDELWDAAKQRSSPTSPSHDD
ncbi:MAG: nucleoside triphosphate pyrophosphohydrolase [Firmicutes bacterium]|nr:nucleoside triphosphate pyrophosphohydrolase [Bacillota bacterium]